MPYHTGPFSWRETTTSAKTEGPNFPWCATAGVRLLCVYVSSVNEKRKCKSWCDAECAGVFLKVKYGIGGNLAWMYKTPTRNLAAGYYNTPTDRNMRRRRFGAWWIARVSFHEIFPSSHNLHFVFSEGSRDCRVIEISCYLRFPQATFQLVEKNIYAFQNDRFVTSVKLNADGNTILKGRFG